MVLRSLRNGSALVACTILLVILSAVAVSLASLSMANLETANVQRQANRALASTESGLDVMHYWLNRVRLPSSTPPAQYFSEVIAHVQSDLAANNISNFRVNDDGSIPTVMLSTVTGQNFRAQWSADPGDPRILRVTANGRSGTAARTITVLFHMVPYHFPIFDFGIATKGPLVLKYNPRIFAATAGWEADIYVESANSLIAVDIGKNATLAGDLDIGNPDATVSCGGSLSLGGTVNQVAPEDRPEFPVPDVPHFRRYATGPVLRKGSDFSQSSYTNAVVAAGTDPNFTATNVSIRGILYIEAPNKVTFGKITSLEGMIVAEGDVNHPGDNQINLGTTDPKIPANFHSGPVPAGAQFDALRQEQGSCILAPGFKVSFMKNFGAINGVIAASGLYFANNANTNVQGTLINYSDQALIIERNINATFDRSGQVKVPAGFDLYRVLHYNPASYSMVW